MRIFAKSKYSIIFLTEGTPKVIFNPSSEDLENLPLLSLFILYDNSNLNLNLIFFFIIKEMAHKEKHERSSFIYWIILFLFCLFYIMHTYL